ncbi:MAG: nlhH 1 [Rhodocyclales bacterium]|nr:nlhH 1 [Rhodocyclales bacterium]MDB5887649.1 nlhH 1 [Rhodocyclales bacterium]
MFARLMTALLTAALAVLTGTAAAQNLPACASPQTLKGGWRTSFVAVCLDRNGRLTGGSQIMHLVPHKGQLYAANGYWEDKHNVIYGGKNPAGPWAQVLRLAGPEEAWQLDLEIGPQHIRTELLKSLSFT